MQKNEESILFLCRNIGTHQEKMVDILLDRNISVTLLCSTKGMADKYKQYLHPYFIGIANKTFYNWTLLLFAPILVFLDTLLFRRTKVIGHYTTTFGWATAFAINVERVIVAYGSDLLVHPFESLISRLLAKVGLKRANKLLVDNISGAKNAFGLGFTGEYQLTPFGIPLPSTISKLSTRIEKHGETILWIRGTESVYNIECFIKALHIVEEYTNTEWKVILAGNGTSSMKIKSQFSDSLKKRVSFLGYVKGKDKLEDLYKKSSIYVSSSLSDGTSVSLLEAMAFGLTIIISDFTNNQYWVRNEHNGYLFDPKKPEKLAVILQQIFTSKITIEEREKQVAKSKKRVKNKGSIRYFEHKFTKLLE